MADTRNFLGRHPLADQRVDEVGEAPGKSSRPDPTLANFTDDFEPAFLEGGDNVIKFIANVVAGVGIRVCRAVPANRRGDRTDIERWGPRPRVILTGINQNPWAHFRRPIDMIFQG